MKKTIFITIFLFLSFNAFCQDSKLSATISYPLTIGDNFLKEFTGYADVGLQYRFWDLNILSLGISANVSFIGNTEDFGDISIKQSGTLVYPRIFVEVPVGAEGRLKPVLGIGYGANIIRSKPSDNSIEFNPADEKRTWEGVNVNLGLAYDISDKIFILGQYDWAVIDREFSTNSDNYNNRGMLIKIGAGYRF